MVPGFRPDTGNFTASDYPLNTRKQKATVTRMSITVIVDETLLRQAEEATNIHDPEELIHRILEEKINRRAAQAKLAALGGTMPDLSVPSRPRNLAAE